MQVYYQNLIMYSWKCVMLIMYAYYVDHVTK